jgi:hypothetical protein
MACTQPLANRKSVRRGVFVSVSVKGLFCKTMRNSTLAWVAETAFFGGKTQKERWAYCRNVCNTRPKIKHQNKAMSTAVFWCVCSPYGSRTRHSSVKGRRLNRLTNEPFFLWGCKNRRNTCINQKRCRKILYPLLFPV